MALRTFVKVSNVTNLSDARYCAGMMVDLMGFNVDPTSEDRINPEDFTEITEWVEGIKYVGEFVSGSKDVICEALNHYPIDYIQLEDYNAIEQINLLGKPLIFKLTINTQEELASLKSKLSYLDELVKVVVIRSDKEALFEAIDAQIGYYNGNLKLLKGFGLIGNDHLAKYPGLELEAEKEERPGFKDYGAVMEVLEAIEED